MRVVHECSAGLDVHKKTVQVVIAELGVDMSRFENANHATSWAGLAPGKNESAGRSKDNYLSSQYRRLAARRGKKRAAVAVARSILVIIYHMIDCGTRYQELGGNYFDERKQDTVQKQLIRRLEKLGLKVTVEPLPTAA